MKSAKETLAQYRLQGFSDELIELLAMEEEDQKFAEALLEALISEQNGSAISESAITTPDNSSSQISDILESEELIKSAYERNGISDSADNTEDSIAVEPDNSEYIPPKLEVIEGGADEYEQTIIPFTPDYALSEEEHEYAVARSLAFFGEIEHEDEITPHYSDAERMDIAAEADWYVDDVEVADITEYDISDDYGSVEVIEVNDEEISSDTAPEFDCIDFDTIGRSTERESNIINFAEAILDLDIARPAEKEWSSVKSPVVSELEEMRDWAQNVENHIRNTQKEKSRLNSELDNRDDTIIVQSREMDQLKTLNAGYLDQISNDSRMLAETQSRLNDLREEYAHSENMLLKFGDEIETLHGQLFTAHAICQNQSSEILDKDRTISELSTAYTTLSDKLTEEKATAAGVADLHSSDMKRTDQTIQMLNREISDLRSQLETATSTRAHQSESHMAQSELIDSLSSELSKVLTERDTAEIKLSEIEKLNTKQQRRIRRLEKIREKIKTLEFENNVFKTETVPNLQSDKEDLVELASEEYNKAKVLDEIAAKRSRRLSYSTTLAAAACLMLVLMPILSWNNIETEKSSIKSEYAMQLAEAEADNIKLEQNLSAVQNELKSLNSEYNSARESWSIELSNLKAEQARTHQDAQIIHASIERPVEPSGYDILEYDDDLLSESVLSYNELEVGERYNDVTGLEEYKEEFAMAEPATQNVELLTGKQIHVRKGEGLSQVLWRVYRTSSPEMVSYISKINNLKTDRRGNPLLKVNQKLTLPKDVNTAMASQPEKTPKL